MVWVGVGGLEVGRVWRGVGLAGRWGGLGLVARGGAGQEGRAKISKFSGDLRRERSEPSPLALSGAGAQRRWSGARQMG